MSGIIIVNKPRGLSSFDVIRKLRKVLGERRMGHIGTLDPLASGVLPIFIGKYTKLIHLFEGADKWYRATIELGKRTDTFDAEGTVLQQSSLDGITKSQVAEVLEGFVGMQQQLAPIYSALKQDGVPLYKLARQGKPVKRKAREIVIYDLVLEQVALPFVSFSVHCSKGTYIRTLADDIGQCLGVGAHLSELTRTQCGSHFLSKYAHTLGEIECAKGDFQKYFVDPKSVLAPMSRVDIDEQMQSYLVQGQRIAVESTSPGLVNDSSAMAINSKEQLVAVGELKEHSGVYQFQPSKILI